MLTVKKLAGLKNVEDVEDAQVIERSNPTFCHWPPTTRQRYTSRLGGGRALSVDSLVN